MLFMPICGIGGVPGVTIGQTCISAPIRIAGDFSIKTFEHPGPITVPPCPVNDPSFVAGPGIIYLLSSSMCQVKTDLASITVLCFLSTQWTIQILRR
jgi:hypothetical protein